MPLQLHIHPEYHPFTPKTVSFDGSSTTFLLGGHSAGRFTPSSNNGIFPTDLPSVARITSDGTDLFLSVIAPPPYGCLHNGDPLACDTGVKTRVPLCTGDRLELGWYDAGCGGWPLYDTWSLVVRMTCTITIKVMPSSRPNALSGALSTPRTSNLTTPSLSDRISSPTPSSTSAISTSVPTSVLDSSPLSTSMNPSISTSVPTSVLPPSTLSSPAHTSSTLVPPLPPTSALLSEQTSPSPASSLRTLSGSSHCMDAATPSPATPPPSTSDSVVLPVPTSPSVSAPTRTPYKDIIGTLRWRESQRLLEDAIMDLSDGMSAPTPSPQPTSSVVPPIVVTPVDVPSPITSASFRSLPCADTRTSHTFAGQPSSSNSGSGFGGGADGFAIAMGRIRDAWLALRRDVVRPEMAVDSAHEYRPSVPPSSSVDRALRRIGAALWTCRAMCLHDSAANASRLSIRRRPASRSGTRNPLSTELIPQFQFSTPFQSPVNRGWQGNADRRRPHSTSSLLHPPCSLHPPPPFTSPFLVSHLLSSFSTLTELLHRIFVLVGSIFPPFR
ncbi:hypothetical protein CF319_g7650 [Tilletia indica]|nr:hypothetical protein CF319_g7650 [Tilletia indica]